MILINLPPLEGDAEEVKEGKGLKILTPNKLLTRLSIISIISNIISTNKSWEKFKQTKKCNHTNTISFVSA